MTADTLFRLDTVFVQYKIDSVSQLDMGQHINTIHSSYDSYMTLILWILGIAFGVIGILVPILIAYIQNKRFTKEIETLKVELKEEIKEEYIKTITNETNSLKNNLELKLEHETFVTEFISKTNTANMLIQLQSYSMALDAILEATKLSSSHKRLDLVKIIIDTSLFADHILIVNLTTRNSFEVIKKLTTITEILDQFNRFNKLEIVIRDECKKKINDLIEYIKIKKQPNEPNL